LEAFPDIGGAVSTQTGTKPVADRFSRMLASGLTAIPLKDRETGDLTAVVETPRGSRNKYSYDPETGCLRLGAVLAEGLTFPYGFGFLPSTLGEDGDPLDVLVLLDTDVPPGCLITVRLIGVLEVEQKAKGEPWQTNNRFIACRHDGVLRDHDRLFTEQGDMRRVAQRLPARCFPATESTMSTDALTLLRTDHRTVDTMFEQFDAEQGEAMATDRADLARRICAEIKVHAQVEEEIFYPEVRKSVPSAADLLDEAIDEHAEAKDQITKIEEADSLDGKALGNLVQELAKMIRHHVKEEEGELFPKVEESDMDLAKLGERMEHRKVQLKAGPPPSGSADRPKPRA
jgi:hemerythrin superfamily protein